MADANQREQSGPAFTDNGENLKKKRIWNDAYARFIQLSRSYEEEYKSVKQEIFALGDMKHDTDFKRAADVEELQQEHQNWVNDSRKVQEAVNDTSLLEEQQKEIESLEHLKKELLDTFIRESDDNKELREKVRELDGPMQRLEQFNNHVYQKEKFEVPTKEFTLKVLKLLSAAYLKEGGDPNDFRGFFTKPQTNDVIPFNYNKDVPEHERIEDVWNTLSQFKEYESSNSVR